MRQEFVPRRRLARWETRSHEVPVVVADHLRRHRAGDQPLCTIVGGVRPRRTRHPRRRRSLGPLSLGGPPSHEPALRIFRAALGATPLPPGATGPPRPYVRSSCCRCHIGRCVGRPDPRRRACTRQRFRLPLARPRRSSRRTPGTALPLLELDTTGALPAVLKRPLCEWLRRRRQVRWELARPAVAKGVECDGRRARLPRRARRVRATRGAASGRCGRRDAPSRSPWRSPSRRCPR